MPADATTPDQPEPKKTFRREDDPDPNVRRGGPFGGGDPSEWEFWAKAFDEAGTPNDPPGGDPPAR